MTRSKKKPVTQLVTVDAAKLSQGLKTAFEGVAMVFDSLGVDAGFDVAEKEELTESKAAAKKTGKKPESRQEDPVDAVQEETDETENAGTDTAGGDGNSDPDGVSAAVDDGEVDTPAEEAQAEEPQETETAEQVSKVTLDDVTKIIVQKIKQDRGNNQKIGQILKTYGAAKVGELDSKKYEAFLTDIAAL